MKRVQDEGVKKRKINSDQQATASDDATSSPRQAPPSTHSFSTSSIGSNVSPQSKDMSTIARLRRAKERQERRAQKNKPERYLPDLVTAARSAVNGTSVTGVETGFGPVNFSKFPTRDPGAKVTTVATNYGKQSVGHKYTEMQDALVPNGTDETEVAAELLAAIRGNQTGQRKAIVSDRQRNAAAKLTAISQSSEGQRVGGTPKEMRGALEMVRQGELTLADLTTGDDPGFAMAKTPNLQRRRVNYAGKKLRKPPAIPPHYDKLADYMSDSSADERSGDESSEPPKKRQKKKDADAHQL